MASNKSRGNKAKVENKRCTHSSGCSILDSMGPGDKTTEGELLPVMVASGTEPISLDMLVAIKQENF